MHCKFHLIEKTLHLRHVWMETKRASTDRSHGKKTRLRNCQLSGVACGGVLAVLIEVQEHVVPVVAAVQKNAHQRPVVSRGLRCQGVNNTERVQARSQRRAA